MSYSQLLGSKYLIIQLLSEWLEVKDLGLLDSALCTKRNRTLFLSHLREFGGPSADDMQHMRGKRSEKAFWNWLKLRKVGVRQITFNVYE